MITFSDFIALALSAFALHQVRELGKRVKALEAKQRQSRPEYIGRSNLPMPPEKVEASTTKEQPKAGTVAAKAIKPVVYLAHVPHTAIQLDNGGLEWEGKL